MSSITESVKPPEPRKQRKPRRVALWTLIIWSALCGIWVIAGANSAQDANDCAAERTPDLVKLCQDATDVGTGIGVALIIGLWTFVTFCIMAVTVIVRLSRRDA
jgi:hypothetical protein